MGESCFADRLPLKSSIIQATLKWILGEAKFTWIVIHSFSNIQDTRKESPTDSPTNKRSVAITAGSIEKENYRRSWTHLQKQQHILQGERAEVHTEHLAFECCRQQTLHVRTNLARSSGFCPVLSIPYHQNTQAQEKGSRGLIGSNARWKVILGLLKSLEGSRNKVKGRNVNARKCKSIDNIV